MLEGDLTEDEEESVDDIPDIVQFPIIAYTSNTVRLYWQAYELYCSNTKELRDNYHLDLKLIDSRLREFRISEAKKGVGIRPFYGFRLFSLRRVYVWITLAPGFSQLDLDQAKGRILDALKASTEHNPASAPTTILVERIKEATRFYDLIRAFHAQTSSSAISEQIYLG